jgi:CheY-like chemotaxis protein
MDQPSHSEKNTQPLRPEVIPSPNLRKTGPLDHIIPWVLEFRIVGTADILKTDLNAPVLLGRMDPHKGIYPQINLDPHGGQAKGVSRRHAKIFAQDNRVMVQDEGSANGTYLNGEKMSSLAPQRLRDGDRLKLGDLELQMRFVMKPFHEDGSQHDRKRLLDVPEMGQGQFVLILDEDEYICLVIKQVAEHAGYTPVVTHTAAEAIQLIDSHPPAMVIMELMIGEVDGTDVLRYLRNYTKRYIPVTGISLATGGSVMGEAIAAGVDMVLSKPISLDEVIGAFRNMHDMLQSTQSIDVQKKEK